MSGLALGLYLVVVGLGIASEYIDQGGGGLAVFFGWGLAGLGCFVLGGSVLAAGIPWWNLQRNNNSDESDPFHAENAESSGLKSTVDSDDIPKA